MKDERRHKNAHVQIQLGEAILSGWTVDKESEDAAEYQPQWYGLHHLGMDFGASVGQAHTGAYFQTQSVPAVLTIQHKGTRDGIRKTRINRMVR